MGVAISFALSNSPLMACEEAASICRKEREVRADLSTAGSWHSCGLIEGFLQCSRPLSPVKGGLDEHTGTQGRGTERARNSPSSTLVSGFRTQWCSLSVTQAGTSSNSCFHLNQDFFATITVTKSGPAEAKNSLLLMTGWIHLGTYFCV